MKRVTKALAMAAVMLLSIWGVIIQIGPCGVLAEVNDEILWQYGKAGVQGSGANELSGPCSAHMLDSGKLLVSDQGNFRIIEIDPANGNIVWQYGTTGVGGSGFNQLGRPAWDAQRLDNGNTLITDTENHRVIEVNANKQIVWQYGTTGVNDLVYFPRDSERLENGNTLISDTDHWRIIEVDSQKNVVWEYTNVNLPTDADRLPNGNTLISEPDGYRVFEVNTQKQIVWQHGTGVRGYAPGQVGVVWDADRLPNGNTLITDMDNHRVIEVNPDNDIVWQYGKNGTSGSTHNLLSYPYDAERLSDGSTLICDMNNHRVIRVGQGEGNVTLLFSDDFSGDLSKWRLYGTPKPFIDGGALKGNGDGFYGSDGVTKLTFDRTKGDIIIEARVKRSQTLRPGWFGYGSITSGNPDVDPVETVYYGFRFQGTLYGEDVAIIYMDGSGTPKQTQTPRGSYDTWHVFKVTIYQEGGADFHVDGELRFSVPDGEKESAFSNESVVMGSHDPPYWFDDVTVLQRSYPAKPPIRFGLVVSTDAPVYDLGDTVKVSAYHWNLANALPLADELVSFQVDAPNGSAFLITSARTSPEGWSNLTFQVPPDAALGPYTLYASTARVSVNSTFRVGLLPLFILSVSVLDSFLPGETIEVQVLTGSAQGELAQLILVLQIFDSTRVPLLPSIGQVEIQPFGKANTQLLLVLPQTSPPGQYSLQVQLMTDLPRDHGFSVDVYDTSFTVG